MSLFLVWQQYKVTLNQEHILQSSLRYEASYWLDIKHVSEQYRPGCIVQVCTAFKTNTNVPVSAFTHTCAVPLSSMCV